jgi:DNA-binding transcriptional LysR family regulator
VAEIPPHMTTEPLADVPFVLVASSAHPLALCRGVIPRSELAKHVQLVLTDRSELSAGKEVGVLSPSTWRLTDLYAKHAFLLKGLGWGGMPLHAVQADLDAKKLVKLRVEGKPTKGMSVPHSTVYPTSTPPGPAGRWLIEQLKVQAATALRSVLEPLPLVSSGQSSEVG